jgi:aldehyde dehydrogenase (NAD+)
MLDAQREHFLTDATRSYYWRIDQLDRMERMLTGKRCDGAS